MLGNKILIMGAGPDDPTTIIENPGAGRDDFIGSDDFRELTADVRSRLNTNPEASGHQMRESALGHVRSRLATISCGVVAVLFALIIWLLGSWLLDSRDPPQSHCGNSDFHRSTRRRPFGACGSEHLSNPSCNRDFSRNCSPFRPYPRHELPPLHHIRSDYLPRVSHSQDRAAAHHPRCPRLGRRQAKSR